MVIAIAATMMVFASALADTGDIAHRFATASSAVAAPVCDLANGDEMNVTADLNCQIGFGEQSCTPVILPNPETAFKNSAGTPARIFVTDNRPIKTGYRPFHPPRAISQV